MAFVAVCPYCHQGKVRASNEHLGLSATCPKCGNSFTLSKPVDPKAKPALSPVVVSPAIALPKPQPHGSKLVADAPPSPPAPSKTSDRVTPPEPVTHAESPPVDIDESDDEVDETPLDNSNRQRQSPLPSLIAIILANTALVASQTPYVRLLTIPLALAAGIYGFRRWLIGGRPKKYRWVPAAGAVWSTMVVVVVVLWPSLLGVTTWWDFRRVRLAGEPTVAVRLGDSGHSMAIPTDGPDEWLDSAKSAWQQGDLRIRINTVRFGPIETKSPKGIQFSKETFLTVVVRIRNVGASRAIDYHGLVAVGAPPETVRLTDASGMEYRLRVAGVGGSTPSKSSTVGIAPGKTHDETLVFLVPRALEYFRLELPGPALGLKTPVRFKIPNSMISEGSIGAPKSAPTGGKS